MDANKKAMLRNIRQALVVTLVLLLLCGFVFPVLLSGLSGLLFPHQAGGSLVTADGKAVGAKLVGQEFTEAYFMKGRPSACMAWMVGRKISFIHRSAISLV